MTLETDDISEFTPQALREYASAIRELRGKLLCDVADSGADPEAEHLFLLSLDALGQAYHYMKLASIKQSQGIQRGRP